MPEQNEPRYPHVHVQLSGRDGNIFFVMGRVGAALRRQVGARAADEFYAAANACRSYDEVIVVAMNTVTVH